MKENINMKNTYRHGTVLVGDGEATGHKVLLSIALHSEDELETEIILKIIEQK